MNTTNIQEKLIALARQLITLRGDHSEKAESERDLVREKIQIIGLTAAFFGGFHGMTKLHDACEAMTGNRNEIGEVLNRAWDGIGDWCS